jgi:hypothetical protein
MVQQRADESVPLVEHGIGEVIIQHRQTRHGVRTVEKSVPVLVQEKPKCGQSSCSKKGQKGHVDPESVECSRVLDPIMDDPQAPQCINEQFDSAPDMDADEGTPKKSNVCIPYFFFKTY